MQRTCRHMSTSAPMFFWSTFTQPSAIWLRQISAACRFRQSGSCAQHRCLSAPRPSQIRHKNIRCAAAASCKHSISRVL